LAGVCHTIPAPASVPAISGEHRPNLEENGGGARRGRERVEDLGRLAEVSTSFPANQTTASAVLKFVLCSQKPKPCREKIKKCLLDFSDFFFCVRVKKILHTGLADTADLSISSGQRLKSAK
jgi:hypothetical protein